MNRHFTGSLHTLSVIWGGNGCGVWVKREAFPGTHFPDHLSGVLVKDAVGSEGSDPQAKGSPGGPQQSKRSEDRVL